MIACSFAIWSLALLAMGLALSDDGPDALVKKLAEFNGAERGRLTPITEESLSRALPGYRFYVLRFRQYPVALVPPEPLGASNLFVVKPDGTVDHVPDTKALEARALHD